LGAIALFAAHDVLLLPLELPTKFEFFINLNAAKTLGIGPAANSA
jgi:hypothetical protein